MAVADNVEVVTVTAPARMKSGMEMQFQTLDGRVLNVVIPPGTPKGGTFLLQIPKAPQQGVLAALGRCLKPMLLGYDRYCCDVSGPATGKTDVPASSDVPDAEDVVAAAQTRQTLRARARKWADYFAVFVAAITGHYAEKVIPGSGECFERSTQAEKEAASRSRARRGK